MDKETILEALRGLAKQQGFYQRIYDEVKENEEALTMLSEQGFTDVIDMIMFLEG